MWSESVSWSVMSLCNPMDYSPPGSSVHGILQARTLEGVAISFSRVSSQPSSRTHIAGRFFTIWATREAREIGRLSCITLWWAQSATTSVLKEGFKSSRKSDEETRPFTAAFGGGGGNHEPRHAENKAPEAGNEEEASSSPELSEGAWPGWHLDFVWMEPTSGKKIKSQIGFGGVVDNSGVRMN